MRIVGLSVLVLGIQVAFGQKAAYLQHNLLKDRALFLVAQGNDAAAAACFDSSIVLMPWDLPVYHDAVLTCLRLDETRSANRLLSEGVSHGFAPEMFSDSLFEVHLNSEASLPFRRSWEADRAMFKAGADTALIAELEAMVQQDQFARAGRDGDMDHVDSLNFEHLLAICDRLGRLPTAPMLGYHISALHLLLWHHRGAEYPTSLQWRRVLPFIHAAIEAGDLDPSFLCMFDDFSDHQAGRPMRYGSLLYYYGGRPDALYLVDPDRLRENRASVGRGSIEELMVVMGIDPASVRFAVP